MANVQRHCQKHCHYQKCFEKVAASWRVSWEFSLISEDSSIWGQLYLKVAAFVLFSCVQRIIGLLSFAYIATPKIFRIILSTVFVSLGTVLLALVSWKLRGFRRILRKGSIIKVAGVLRYAFETRCYKNLKNKQL